MIKEFLLAALTFLFDNDFDLVEIIRDVVKISMTVAIFFALAYGVLAYLNGKNGIDELVHQKRTQWDAFAAITFCSLIGIVYVAFVWIQIAGLFRDDFAHSAVHDDRAKGNGAKNPCNQGIHQATSL